VQKRLEKTVAFVTGANTGIGRATALELANAGAHVFVACRSQPKGEEAASDIRARSGNERVEFFELDLASLASVRAGAARFLERGLPLSLLINNAGVAGQRGETKEGFELHFGTNHLGHFLLTDLLLERIKASAPARIVNVSSTMHYKAKALDLDAVHGFTKTITGLPEYEVSKLANVLFSAELARRLAGSRVTTYSLHPGGVASDAYRRIPWPFRKLVTMGMLTNEEGAKTSLHCALSEEAGRETGLYYDKSRVREPSALARDEQLAKKLWERSVGWTSA
jgi:retinol dehydrogenase 12